MIKEVPFLHFNVNGQDNYGGNQEWYADRFAQMAGCSAVLASNLYYYYTNHLNVSYPAYRETMDFWFEKNKPGLIGFPYFMKFIHNFLEEMAYHHLSLRVEMKKGTTSIEDGWSFVTHAIDEGRPVGMLILTHTSKAIDEETWHWMCITGYDDEKKEVIISSVGQRITMDAKTLFQPCFRNVVKMLSFVNPKEDYSSQVIVHSSTDGQN